MSPARPAPIIDTHQHLWDLKRFKLSWLSGKLDRSFLMAEYVKAAEGLGIEKTVYMEVGVDPVQRRDEAEYVLEIIRRKETPMVAAVIAGDLADEKFRGYLKEKKRSAIKGVRAAVPGGADRRREVEPAFVEGVRLLGDLGMSFDLNTDLHKALALTQACPGTRFILDHCGGANLRDKDRGPWERDLSAIARRPNVVCKISGFIATAPEGRWKPTDLEPVVNHVIKSFGVERVMFAGDWPVCTLAATLRQWVEALRGLVQGYSEKDQRRIFHDNAEAFYGLE